MIGPRLSAFCNQLSCFPKMSILLVLLVLCALFLRPILFPRVGKIPFIPFHISLYDALRGVGKTALYDNRLRPLTEKYGAVWYWSAGRWVVILTVGICKEGALYKSHGSGRLLTQSTLSSSRTRNII
jgi:hypothetical protein